MKQQINLYQPLFRKQRRVLSGKALLQSLAAVAVGLALVQGYAAWQVYRLDSRVAALGAQRDAAAVRLVGLESKLPQRRKSNLLAAEVTRLERHVDARRRLLDGLTERAQVAQAGFSGFLEGLARQRVEGLWLTGFRIGDGGRELELRGRALRPDLVPILVQRLGAEPDFAGAAFSALVIDRREDGAGPVNFSLKTRLEEE